jgi:hypothetical protein
VMIAVPPSFFLSVGMFSHGELWRIMIGMAVSLP